MFRGDRLAVRKLHAAHMARAIAIDRDIDILDAILESVFAAQRFDRGAQAFHHLHQAERANMRLGGGEDFFRRPCLHELGQNLAAEKTRILDLAVELAVRKCSRAAFAELHIGFGIEDRTAPQAPGVLRAFAHHLAAIQNDGPKTHLREDQGGEQSAWTRADYKRAFGQALRRLRYEFVFGIGREADVAVTGSARQYSRFILHRDIDRIDQRNRRFLARIMAAANDGLVQNVARRNAQALGDGGAKCVRCVAQRQLDFGQTEHNDTYQSRGGQSQRLTTLSNGAGIPALPSLPARQRKSPPQRSRMRWREVPRCLRSAQMKSR